MKEKGAVKNKALFPLFQFEEIFPDAFNIEVNGKNELLTGRLI